MGRSPVFDLDDLAAAGLAVVAAAGWEAVSVRAVAGRLGVSPMALYRVVPDAAGLRRAVADAAARPLLPPAGAGDLAATLARWAEAAYAHLVALPGLAAHVLVAWTELPAWLDVVEALLARAAAAGVTGADGVAAVNAVFAYVLARAQVRDGLAGTTRRLAPVAADPGRYPHVAAEIGEFTTARTTRHFRYGLRALTAGLP
jgi:AcrR family transcriptional regulator